jgi:hypothetical protein
MLSIKFGADTTRLERAMKRVRKSMANMFTARGLIGGAIAGVGAAGVIGAAMNLNPRVANSILRLESHLTGAFASALYKMEPAIVRLTDTLISVADVFLSAVGEASSIYEQAGKMAEQFGQFLGNLIPRSGQLDPTGLRQGIVLGGLINGQLNIDQSQALLDMLEREPRFVPNSTEQIAGSARKGPNERRPNGD